MKNISKKDIKGYSWKFSGIIPESTGPSVFMLLAAGGVIPSVGVMYFLLLGGIAMLLLTFTEDQDGNLNLRKMIKESFQSKIFLRLIMAGSATSFLFICFIYSMQYESVTEAVIAVRIGPLFKVLLSVLILKDKIKNWGLIILAVVFCIIGLVIMKKIDSFSLANLITPFLLFALAAAFFAALSGVIEGDLQNCSNLSKAFISGSVMIIGGIMLLVWILVMGVSLILPKAYYFISLLYLGMGTIGIPKFTTLKAYKITGNMSMFAFTEYLIPVLACIWAYTINKERGFDYITLTIGFLLIIIGLLIANAGIEKKN